MTPGLDPLDRSDLDTWLAWQLLRAGRLPREVLRQLLAAARQARDAGGPTLARSLAARGLLAPAELQRILEEGAAAVATPSPAAAARARQVGEFDLLEELGAGGMGTVYRARHRATGALCAIKTLVAADPELLLRFQREGEGQARVDDHPHVVRVHSLGRDRGTSYLVMELVEGGSLARRLRDGLPPPEVAARWVRDLAGAVEHAHRRGVLHRDIKPENVLFSGEVPRLVDFGLARLADAGTLTATGAVLGTPAYMAPEQVDGSRGPLGPATDVYGLGALLYCCLTGRPPFGGGSVVLTLLQVTEEAPTSPRALRPEVPPALEAVCLRALAKDPAARFPSAAALGEALNGALAGAPPPATRRRRARAVVGLALSGLAAGVLVRALGSGGAPPPPPPVLPVPTTSASPPPLPAALPALDPAPDAPTGPPLQWLTGRWTAESEARYVRGRELRDEIARGRSEPMSEAEVRAQLLEAVRTLEELAATPPSGNHGRVYRELGVLYHQLGELDRAIRCLARAALVGEYEAPAILGFSALELGQQPVGIRTRWRLELLERGRAVPGASGFERPLALAKACFVLALREPTPDGSSRPRPLGDSDYLHRVTELVPSLGALPDYSDAYRTVWAAFPGCRPE